LIYAFNMLMFPPQGKKIDILEVKTSHPNHKDNYT